MDRYIICIYPLCHTLSKEATSFFRSVRCISYQVKPRNQRYAPMIDCTSSSSHALCNRQGVTCSGSRLTPRIRSKRWTAAMAEKSIQESCTTTSLVLQEVVVIDNLAADAFVDSSMTRKLTTFSPTTTEIIAPPEMLVSSWRKSVAKSALKIERAKRYGLCSRVSTQDDGRSTVAKRVDPDSSLGNKGSSDLECIKEACMK